MVLRILLEQGIYVVFWVDCFPIVAKPFAFVFGEGAVWIDGCGSVVWGNDFHHVLGVT
jgi:hypothetical protein